LWCAAIETAEQLLSFYRDLLGMVPSNNLATDVVMRRTNTTVNALAEYVTRLVSLQLPAL
jgi:hypothetical protein